MKKDWVSLTDAEQQKFGKQITKVLWRDQDKDFGPLWMELKNGTTMNYQKSRFHYAEPKWFPSHWGQELAKKLKVPFEKTPKI